MMAVQGIAKSQNQYRWLLRKSGEKVLQYREQFDHYEPPSDDIPEDELPVWGGGSSYWKWSEWKDVSVEDE